MKELLNTGVSLDFEYDENCDALIGQVKGYTVVIKENLSTGSYGCFCWAREGDFSAITDINEYLTDKQKLEPELIKRFRVTELGAAIALTRSDDDFVNVNTLKKFVYDFTTNLSLNFYKNCCFECGKTENLAVFEVDGTAAQACAECGSKRKFILSFDDSFTAVSAPAVVPEEVFEEKEEEIVIPTPEIKQEIPAEPVQKADNDDFSDLMLDGTEEALPVQEESVAEPDTAESDYGHFLFGAEEEKAPEPPKSKIFEEAEREFAEEKARLAAMNEQNKQDDGMNDLLLTPVEPESSEPVENVSEYYKEKDIEGDFTVEEIKRTVDMPTITDGPLQLSAEETPLDENGKIPLINPMTNLEERLPSDPNGPNAVQPLEMGATDVNEKIFGPGFSSGNGMDRDNSPPPYNPSVVHSSSYNKTTMNTVPPPYNPEANYSSYVYPVAIKEKSNVFMGIIGALVIGLIGVAVWVLIGTLLDIISYWGGLAIVASVFGGYYFAGRAMDKKGIIVSFLLSFVMTAAGLVIIYVVEMMNAGLNISFFEGVRWFVSVMSDTETNTAFISDFSFSFLITLIAGLITSVSLWKRT